MDAFRRMEENSERDAVGRKLFDTHIKPGGAATVSLPSPLRDELVNTFMSNTIINKHTILAWQLICCVHRLYVMNSERIQPRY